jgi:hypothetical protein
MESGFDKDPEFVIIYMPEHATQEEETSREDNENEKEEAKEVEQER